MGEITRIDGTESPSEGHEVIPHQADLIEVTNGILMDTRSELLLMCDKEVIEV